MSVRWCYVVESVDRNRLFARERFMFPNDANKRAESLRSCGFYSVRVYQRRVKSHGAPRPTQPGFLQLK